MARSRAKQGAGGGPTVLQAELEGASAVLPPAVRLSAQTSASSCRY